MYYIQKCLPHVGGWVGPWAILDKYTFMSMIVLCFFVFDDCVVYKFMKFAEIC